MSGYECFAAKKFLAFFLFQIEALQNTVFQPVCAAKDGKIQPHRRFCRRL